MATTDKMERLFRDLGLLLKTGQFTRLELEFMAKFLLTSLAAVTKVLARAAGETPDDDYLIEKLAALAHRQWSGWMQYLFGKCEDQQFDGRTQKVIPAWAVERWQRQMTTPYAELPEKEKESDREEARRVLAALEGESR
jgi:hypothetical protein